MQLHKNLVIAAQLLCEPLPISSSTHVWIADFLWRKNHLGTPTIAIEHLMDLLFLPTLLVLIAFFRHHVIHLLKTIFTPTKYNFKSPQYKHWWTIMLRVAGYLIVATIMFATVFLSLRYLVTLTPPTEALEWIPPIIGLSLTMLLQTSLFFAPNSQATESSLCLWKAMVIGISQGFAAIPGISRLGATLTAARWLNIPPHRAFEFSTLLQIIVFIGNLIKNMFLARTPGQLLSLKPYMPIIHALSWDSIIIILVCTTLSYAGLVLTKTLNSSKQLWKFAPYFLVPIGLIASLGR